MSLLTTLSNELHISPLAFTIVQNFDDVWVDHERWKNWDISGNLDSAYLKTNDVLNLCSKF